MAGADLDTFTTFGEYLRYLRRRARLTQRELGIAVGYSDVQIARLEKNQRLPDVTMVHARFVEALDLQNQPALAARLVELATAMRPATDERSLPDLHSLPSHRRTNLPVQLTRFIGRETEKARVTGLLAENRLVTLTGSGGVGKTRLALEVGGALLNQFPDGVWLVELAPLADSSLLPKVTAEVFGLQEQAGGTLVQALIVHLEDKHALLILDNCEHLVQACAELAEALLRACPQLHLLATSREPLRVLGEVAWRVPSLSTPDPVNLPPLEQVLDYEAVRLFIQHAALVQPDFKLTPDAVAVIARVCHRLDGIPLAIELAAARMRALSAHEIATRLDDRFRLLVGGSRTSLPRQQTLRATLDWSYDLLSEPEQILLRRLAVFAGGWTADAAEAVCADLLDSDVKGQEARESRESSVLLPASDIVPLLFSLVDKSMVVADAEPQSGNTRYRMLETIRQYAAERLEEAGKVEVACAHNRCLDYFLALAIQIEEPGAPAGDEHWRGVDQIQTEIDNYRATLAWSLTLPVDDARGLQLVWALNSLWFERENFSEGRAWLGKALAKWTRRTQDRARALNTAGLLAFVTGDYIASRAELTESVRLSRDVGDKLNLADALNRLARTTLQLAQTVSAAQAYLLEADGYLVEALRIARENGFQPIIGYALVWLGDNALMEAKPDQARRLAEQALAIFQQCGEKPGLYAALWTLAHCARFVQNWNLARTYLEQCVALARELDSRRLITAFLLDLALVVREQGDYALAIRLLEDCQVVAQQLRRTNALPIGFLSRIRIEQGRTVQLQGDVARAEALLNESVSLCRAAGERIELANALNALAAFSLTQADVASATWHYREGLGLSHQAQSQFVIAVGLAGMAEVLRLRGQLEGAARLCGVVAVLGDIKSLTFTLTTTFTVTDLQAYDCTMAAMRTQLDDPMIAAAWAEGQCMTLAQAVAYALASG